jgi:hypothetical protein
MVSQFVKVPNSRVFGPGARSWNLLIFLLNKLFNLLFYQIRAEALKKT